LGRIGKLREPIALADFAGLAKECLDTPAVRLVGDGARLVSKIAVCGGSGSSLLREAAKQGADLLLTGDVKYHEAREAEALGVALLDAGHFATERLMVAGLTSRLREELASRRMEVTVVPCDVEIDPFTVV
jgi:putative NIF3 family GTP cyclohydrolase 1 type 2